MDEKELYEQAKKLMMNGVDKVLSGELQEYSSRVISPEDIIDYLCSHHGMKNRYLEDTHTNGWQGDLWARTWVKGKSYNISSSAYHNTETRFGISDEQDG